MKGCVYIVEYSQSGQIITGQITTGRITAGQITNVFFSFLFYSGQRIKAMELQEPSWCHVYCQHDGFRQATTTHHWQSCETFCTEKEKCAVEKPED